jgi:hypothetical protein
MYIDILLTHQVNEYKLKPMSNQSVVSMDGIMSRGSLTELLHSGLEVTPDDLSMAAQHGHIHILDYFAAKGILPDERAYHWAARAGLIDVLDWMWNHDLEPDEDTITESEANSIDVLMWLEDHGMMLDTWAANSVSEDIRTLEWLERRDILPDVNGANLAAGRGNIKFLHWMAERGIYPDDVGLTESVGNSEVFFWIIKQGVQPTVYTANVAARHGCIDILDYLESIGILPEKELTDYAIEYIIETHNTTPSIILDWLLARGIVPSTKGLLEAIRSLNLPLLQWILEHAELLIKKDDPRVITELHLALKKMEHVNR